MKVLNISDNTAIQIDAKNIIVVGKDQVILEKEDRSLEITLDFNEFVEEDIESKDLATDIFGDDIIEIR